MKKSIKKIGNNKEFLVNCLADASFTPFWAKFGVHIDTPNDVYENAKLVNESREDIWAEVLLNGGFLLIEDVEEEKEHKVSLKDVEKGLKTLIFNYPRNYANIMTEEGDFSDYDALLQCVVFGDVIYG